MLAAKNGHAEAAERLLDAGADIDAMNEVSGVVNALKSTGVCAMLTRLLSRRCQDGETALMIGADYGHAAVTACLLNRGANVNAKAEVGDDLDC